MQTDSTIETIQAMHSQELSGYVSGDYLNMYSPELVAVNVDCRTKMAQWCYSVRIYSWATACLAGVVNQC